MNLSIQNKTKNLTLLSMTVIILLLAGCSSNEPKNPPQVNPIPKIHIYTDNGLDPDCKENYLSAKFSFDGKGTPWEDIVEKPMGIRGRGNSTWMTPKKPWRVNFSSANATSLFGLPPARDWVFLANYYDQSFLFNAVAFELGHRLEMPLTPTSHFIELYLNGTCRGLYQVTEHLRQNTIPNLGADDLLMELDVNFDEDFQFYSNLLELPVMMQSPRSQAGANKAKIIWDNVENTLFGPVYENAPEVLDSNWRELFDVQSLMKYLLVYELMGNGELEWPKSLWMRYLASDGKIHFGPIWDFDWAWVVYNTYPWWMSGLRYTHHWPPLLERNSPGAKFIYRFFDDPTFVQEYKEYCKSVIGNLNTDRFVDSLGVTLKPYAEKDYQIWDKIYNYDYQISWFKNFYNKRLSAMKDYMNQK